MKITIISDTHSYHKSITNKIKQCDMVIHCGDMSSVGYIHEITAFSNWMDKLPAHYKIFIAGNHDRSFDNNESLAIASVSPSVIYLRDSMVEIEGIKIYGTPSQPEFCNWAFNHTDEQQDQYFSLIPEGVDILITHCPPYGILDTLESGEQVGSKVLLKHLDRVKPKFHCFGHIHCSNGILVKDGTTYINASICTEQYRPLNKVHIFEI